MSESWVEGKYLPITGRVIFNFSEIYAIEGGREQSWVETAEWFPILTELMKEFKIEMTVTNQLSITHDLWD
jgi:hypothetical protein